MGGSLFDIVFRGDILPGQQLVEVKQRLKQLFKVDDDKVHALFTSGAVPLKRNLTLESAEKYQQVLKNAGAHVQIAEAGSVKSRPPRPVPTRSVVDAKPQPRPELQPRPESQPQTNSQRKLTMAERLAAMEASDSPAEALFQARDLSNSSASDTQPHQSKAQEIPAVVPISSSVPPLMAVEEVEDDDSIEDATHKDAHLNDTLDSQFTLAPVGADVLRPEERHAFIPVEVDVSGISVRENDGELLDASEREDIEPLYVDISGISLAEEGEDLLSEDEKYRPPVPEISVEGWDIAPVGSDMGQLKAPVSAPTLDLSGLTLVPENS